MLPGETHWDEQMTHRFVVVPAAYVILRSGFDVLLQLRENTGYMDGCWGASASGHVEAGESVFAAACREAAEEIGITILADDLTPLTTMHRTTREGEPIDQRVDWFFECRRWSGEPRLLEPERAVGLRWFPLHALPDLVVPHERSVLEALRDGGIAPVVTYGF